MIELKITSGAAMLLLTERMKLEFEARKRKGLTPRWSEVNDLAYHELLQLAEIAAFDLIATLPPEILVDRNNLDEIIVKAMRSLTGVYSKDRFANYSHSRAKKLIAPIIGLFKLNDEVEVFTKN